MSTGQTVYILWHGDDLDEGPDAKLLGVYSTEEAATARIERAKLLPGFRDHPDAFAVSRYQLDRDELIEGYIET